MRKKLTSTQIFDLVAGIIMEICLWFPWIEVEGIRLNNLTYFLYGLKSENRLDIFKMYILHNMKASSPEAVVVAQVVWFATGVLLVMCLITLIQVIGSFTKHSFRMLQLVSMIVLMDALLVVGELVTRNYGTDMTPPLRLYGYFGIVIAIQGLWMMFGKMATEWEEASKRAEQEREEWKEYQRQRKIRLKFPGRYSKLYYKVLWKSFCNRLHTYSYLFVSTSLAVMFLFIGLSMSSIFTVGDGSEQGIFGLGIEQIMSDFLIVTIAVSLFLITTIFVFYRKHRMTDVGVLQTLGIRSKASQSYWLTELFAGIIGAIVVGIALGYGFIWLLCMGTYHSSVLRGDITLIDKNTFIATICIAWVIYLCAYGFSHEIQANNQTMDARGMASKSEPIPGRFGGLCLGLCAVLAMFCMNLYSQRRTVESVFVLCGFFIGLYGVVHYGWALILKRQEKHMEQYVPKVPQTHMVRHRFKTTVRYIMLLTIIHISILFYFCMRIVSSGIALDQSSMYPYDYVFLANSQDQEFIQNLRETYHGEVQTFPMIRTTAMDATDELEPPRKLIVQQAQNIGISETTYRALKNLVGEKPKEDLGLDDNGNNVYIVYQQDKGTHAQPLDRYQLTKYPYVHIGQPLFGYNVLNHRPYYPMRNIAGEETTSLTGSFSSGRYENLVVFSDAYFEKVKDNWKTIDMNTGEPLKEGEGVMEENIHEYPTTLTLVRVPEQYQKQMEQAVTEFRSAHEYDESFDTEVKSAYSKTEPIKKRHIECLMEMIVNGCVSVLFLIVSLLLVHMKVNMELPEFKERYGFMECFGMCEKERIKLEKKEVSRYVSIPLIITACIVPMFTGIVWYMRGFGIGDMIHYVLYGVIFVCCYVLIQVINMRILQKNIVRKVEESIGRKRTK